MTWSLGTISIKDKDGNTKIILAGTDTTNYAFCNHMVDGIGGANLAGVDASNRQLCYLGSGAVAAGALASGSVATGAFASGSIASGAIASGAIASGAVASGAVASGAFASGSISDGAMVTLGAKADAKSSATDATAITLMQVAKQISASVQLSAVETGGNLATAVASLSVMDDWDETDRAKVNLIVGQAGVAAGNGAMGATVIRTCLATDSPGVIAAGTSGSPSANIITIQGYEAHDAPAVANPVLVGGKATTALSGLTLVADADATYFAAGIDRVQLTRPYCNLEDIVDGNASNTDGTSTSCIASSGAGIRTCITSVAITNMSSTGIYVELKDGSTARYTLPVPANSGCVKEFNVPLRGTAATAWNFDPSAAATTVYCSMIGFKSKV